MKTYLNTSSEEVKGGFIKLYNRGAFIAAFTLTYYINGKKHTVESVSIPVMWDYTLHIPQKATNITFSVQVAMFFGVWRTIYTQQFDSPVNKCYMTQGVTVYATCNEISCPDSGNSSSFNNNICCCKCNSNTNDGIILKLYNRGAFVALTTITYQINGQWYVVQSPSIAVMQEYPMYIPYNAQNVNFMVDIAMFFGVWRRIYFETLKSFTSKCYITTGITSYANCYEVPCFDIANGSNSDKFNCI